MPSRAPHSLRTGISVSTAHLSGATLKASEAWTSDTAPVPMFGAHAFGFYCAVAVEIDADVPHDLRGVLIWAYGCGADFLIFDCDGPRHAALPDREATHDAPAEALA